MYKLQKFPVGKLFHKSARMATLEIVSIVQNIIPTFVTFIIISRKTVLFGPQPSLPDSAGFDPVFTSWILQQQIFLAEQDR
jgi:hypothetical protein